MLILTRNIGQTIVVGDNIRITVLGVAGNQVRLGVNAPRETSVHREEIYQKIQFEKDMKGESGQGLETGNKGPNITHKKSKLARANG